jgi:hypothetical protein
MIVTKGQFLENRAILQTERELHHTCRLDELPIARKTPAHEATSLLVTIIHWGTSRIREQAMSAATTSSADFDLEQRIRSFLAGRNYPALQGLEIEVRQGVVSVSGHVDTFHEKQLATNCCQRVAGVLQVINNVDVRHHRVDSEQTPSRNRATQLRRRK